MTLNNPSMVPVMKTITRDMQAVSGAVPYTGVGFKPTALLANSNLAANILSVGSVHAVGTDRCLLTNATSAYSRSTLIHLADTGGVDATQQAAVLTSYDSDGFTLTWTKTGAPAARSADIEVLCIP